PLIGRPGPAGVFPVVVGERVGDDEVRAALHRRPVGELVVVRVGVVEEAALLDEQLARVDARSVATVPAERPLADRLGERRDGFGDVLTLGRARQLECLIQRQPWLHTSTPALRIAAAAGGLRSMASAQPNTVRGRRRSWNRRIRRQKPTRLPYSNMVSAARSRPFAI